MSVHPQTWPAIHAAGQSSCGAPPAHSIRRRRPRCGRRHAPARPLIPHPPTLPPFQGGWQLLLDTRPVRTPARNPLIVPSRALALALAAEWEWLPRGRPTMHAMPLTGLAATAIDEVGGVWGQWEAGGMVVGKGLG